MSISEAKSVTVPQLAVIAATRGAIGFGAGLLLADKLGSERRKVLGWSLFLTGLASTVPIAMHLFGKKNSVTTQKKCGLLFQCWVDKALHLRHRQIERSYHDDCGSAEKPQFVTATFVIAGKRDRRQRNQTQD